jgi:hypothetical protein
MTPNRRAGRRPDRFAGRVQSCPSSVVSGAGAAAPSAGRLLPSNIRRARCLDVVWTRSLRPVPALRFLCRSHLEGSRAGRSSRSAANKVRTGHQPQDAKALGLRARCNARCHPRLCRFRVKRDRCGRSHARMYVRCCPKADKYQIVSVCPLSAISALTHRSKEVAIQWWRPSRRALPP